MSGHGVVGTNQDNGFIAVPSRLIVENNDVECLISHVFPNLHPGADISGCAILCPTNSDAAVINAKIVSRFNGLAVRCFGVTAMEDDSDVPHLIPTEFSKPSRLQDFHHLR